MKKQTPARSFLLKNRLEKHASKNKSLRDYLSEGTLIAIATSLSYTVAFLYELGYCLHMGIPSHLISLTATNILVAFSFLIALVFALFYSVNMVNAVVPQKIHPHLRIRLKSILILAIALYLLYGFQGFSRYIFVGISGLILLPYLENIFFTKGSFHERLDNIAATEAITEKTYEKGYIENTIGSRNSGYLLLFFIAGLIAFLIGGAFAGGQREFLALKDNSKMVLVKSYGETLIFVEIDEAKKRVGSDFLIRKLPADSAPLALQAVRVGPFEKIHYECSEEFRKRFGEHCKN